MNIPETMNFVASVFTGAASLVFMAIFVRRPTWRTTNLGRMLMTLVASIAALCWIVVIYYVTKSDPDWVRVTRSLLLMVVGTMIIVQTVIMVRLRHRAEPVKTPSDLP